MVNILKCMYILSFVVFIYPAIDPEIGIKEWPKNKNVILRLSIKFALKWYIKLKRITFLLSGNFYRKTLYFIWIKSLYFTIKCMSILYTLYFIFSWLDFQVFFAFSSHVKLCLICFGPCQTNKVPLYFIHKVKFYKDKVDMPTRLSFE